MDAYPTKQALVVAVLQRWHGSWRRALDHITTVSVDPRDEVLGIFGYLEECFEDEGWRGGCAFINGHAELGRQDPDIADLAREHFLDIERHLTLVCQRGGMPAHVAQGLSLLIEGAPRRIRCPALRAAGPLSSTLRSDAHVVYESRPLSDPRPYGRPTGCR